jgi:hypothetical protein
MTYYVGLDLAKRSDYSALVILDAHTRQIRSALRLPHADFTDQIGSIMPMLRQAKAVAVDRGGVGDAVIELLPRFLRIIPVLITGGGSVVERKGQVSVGKRPLIELLIKSGVSVAEDAIGREDLKAEMQAFALKAGASGRFKMEARSGSHDDLVIAAGLAVLAASLDARKDTLQWRR